MGNQHYSTPFVQRNTVNQIGGSVRTEAKRQMTPKQSYSFRYWRRGFKQRGMHLDRIALRNGIQFRVSCPFEAEAIVTLDPGKLLTRLDRARHP